MVWRDGDVRLRQCPIAPGFLGELAPVLAACLRFARRGAMPHGPGVLDNTAVFVEALEVVGL